MDPGGGSLGLKCCIMVGLSSIFRFIEVLNFGWSQWWLKVGLSNWSCWILLVSSEGNWDVRDILERRGAVTSSSIENIIWNCVCVFLCSCCLLFVDSVYAQIPLPHYIYITYESGSILNPTVCNTIFWYYFMSSSISYFPQGTTRVVSLWSSSLSLHRDRYRSRYYYLIVSVILLVIDIFIDDKLS